MPSTTEHQGPYGACHLNHSFDKSSTGSLGAKETVGREELNIWSPCLWRLSNILHPIPHACDFSDQALSFPVNSLELGNKYLLNTAEVDETNKNPWDFHGGPVVKNPPANTGDADSIPGPRRFHMPLGNWIHVWRQLSLCFRAPEPQLLGPWATKLQKFWILEPALLNKRSHGSENPMHYK